MAAQEITNNGLARLLKGEFIIGALVFAATYGAMQSQVSGQDKRIGALESKVEDSHISLQEIKGDIRVIRNNQGNFVEAMKRVDAKQEKLADEASEIKRLIIERGQG